MTKIDKMCYSGDPEVATHSRSTAMNVSLTPEFESFVEEKVKSGTYGSASEVVRAGLRLLQERDELHQAHLAAMRDDVRKGREQLERGEGREGAEVFAELRRKRHARRGK